MAPTPIPALPPDISVVLAPNPSPMTAQGTNTYVIGPAPFVVIDPGPAHDGHLAAILAATQGRVAGILVTHSHLDHSPLARPLADATGAQVFAFGDSVAGRSAPMQALADTGGLGGGEGVDAEFVPDVVVQDGATLRFGDRTFTALWTPGHFGNHLSFVFGDAIFCGDHVMAWSTSLVSPPDGDLGAFMRSCQRLLDQPQRLYLPGHGAPLADGPARTRWLMDHRRGREAQVLAALAHAPGTAQDLAAAIYTDLAPALLPAAARNVLAHLLDLHDRGTVTAPGVITADSQFALAKKN